MTEENIMDGIKDISVKRLKWLSENMDRLVELGNSKDFVISTLALYDRGQILDEGGTMKYNVRIESDQIVKNYADLSLSEAIGVILDNVGTENIITLRAMPQDKESVSE